MKTKPFLLRRSGFVKVQIAQEYRTAGSIPSQSVTSPWAPKAKGFYLVYITSGTSGERIDVHTEEITAGGESGRRAFDGVAAMAITKSRFRADAERKPNSAPGDWTAYTIGRR